MLTYDDFKTKIYGILKARLKNHVFNMCDIDSLVYETYIDIQNEVVLGYDKYQYTIDGNYEIEIPKEHDLGIRNAIYDVYDESMNTIFCKFTYPSFLTAMAKDATFIDNNIGENIYFACSIKYDLDKLPSHLYSEILEAIISGVIHKVYSSIPSQIDSAIENREYQRYYQAKQMLKNRFPQMIGTNKYPCERKDSEWLI